jgi:hypothetical protein
MFCLFVAFAHMHTAAGDAPVSPGIQILEGARSLINRDANRALNALLWGSVIFFVLSGMRFLLRRDWLAAAMASLLMTFVEGNVRTSDMLHIDAPIYFSFYLLYMVILLRLGLMPSIFAIFVLNTIGDIPVGGEYRNWYNWMALVQLSLVAAIAVYGFYRSQQRSTPLRHSTSVSATS